MRLQIVSAKNHSDADLPLHVVAALRKLLPTRASIHFLSFVMTLLHSIGRYSKLRCIVILQGELLVNYCLQISNIIRSIDRSSLRF